MALTCETKVSGTLNEQKGSISEMKDETSQF